MIVAHGNQTFGYSLYLKDRVPHFGVRLSGMLLEVRGRDPVDLDRWIHLAATIDPQRRMTLFVGGEEAGRLVAGQLVTQRPREGLNVGADLGGRVGEYDTPMHFRGLIRRVRVYWGVMDDFYAWCSPRVGPGDFGTTHDRSGPWIVAPGGKPILRYMTEKPIASKLTADSVACFHPLCTPSGEVVTAFAPDDHLHHRGVFLAWYAMQGGQTKADFWGWGRFAPTEGRVIETGDWRTEKQEDRVTMHVRNHWLADGAPMIHEDLAATVRPQGPANVVDLTYTLRPTADVTIDRSAFGGFCVRCRNDGEITFTGPDGVVSRPPPHYLKPETDWPAASGYDLSVKLADGKTVGAAVLDHPQNPPSGWHNVARLGMINPCITAAGPVTIKKGKPLVLRYRLVVHDGPAPIELLRKLSAEWEK